MEKTPVCMHIHVKYNSQSNCLGVKNVSGISSEGKLLVSQQCRNYVREYIEMYENQLNT